MLITIVNGIIDVAYTLNKKVAISLACVILFATWSIMTWFCAGGIQDSSKQTNQSMGCSAEVPIQLVPPHEKSPFDDEAAFSNPSMSIGETMNLERETSAQRFQKGIVVVVVAIAPEVRVRLGIGICGVGDRCLVPNPAPSAREETNTSRERGLAAFPKFCAVSKTTPNSAGVDVDVDDDELLPPPLTNNLRRIGIVATTIPISTPITGGGNKVFAKESSSSFRVDTLLLFPLPLLAAPLLPNNTDRPKLQKKGDQPTRNIETNPVLSARLSFVEAAFRKRESQKISGTTPAFPKEAHTAVPRASSVSRSWRERKHGYRKRVVKQYNRKDCVAARTGTASELFERPYLEMVLRIEVPKNSGNRIEKVVLLRALMVAAFSNPRSIDAMPTPELTTSSSAARVAACTAGFVATEAKAVLALILAEAPISDMVSSSLPPNIERVL
jgi:hypothetical protein